MHYCTKYADIDTTWNGRRKTMSTCKECDYKRWRDKMSTCHSWAQEGSRDPLHARAHHHTSPSPHPPTLFMIHHRPHWKSNSIFLFFVILASWGLSLDHLPPPPPRCPPHLVQEDSSTTHFSASSPAALDHSEPASGRDTSPTGSFSHYNTLTNATNKPGTLHPYRPKRPRPERRPRQLQRHSLILRQSINQQSNQQQLQKASPILLSAKRHDPTMARSRRWETLRKRKIRLEDTSSLSIPPLIIKNQSNLTPPS